MSDATWIERIRSRFKALLAAEWLDGPRKLYRFAELSVAKARADHLGQQAASLAFVTIISLVPLLGALSFLGARWFDDRQQDTVALLSQLLPYSESAILQHLSEFVDQARAIRGIGFAAFVLAAMTVFTSIEATINRIWNVSRRRPFRSRLLSVTLALFWGPLVIGSSYSLLFYLEQQPAFQSLTRSLPVRLIPFIVTLLGLTMLYWLVPYTRVRFRSALAGGITAALLLTGLRQGFGIYVEKAKNISVIYGGLGLLLFFMISIQLAWWIILLGSEVAYSLQNANYLSSRRRRAAPLDGSWVALCAMVAITERFRAGQPLTSHERLAERLQLEAGELAKILEPLLRAKLLCEASGDTEGYLLASDPHELTARQILDVYESEHRELLGSLPESLSPPLTELRERLIEHRDREGEDVVLARLAGSGNGDD